VELKFLVPEQDRSVFPAIEKYFAARGWIKITSKDNHLLTRQIDTPARKMLAAGTTLRIRGTCRNDNIDDINRADICVKLRKSTDGSGALRRGEFETETGDFNKVDLKKLLAAHPKEVYPDLHKALKGIRPAQLREFFRIDCYRDRYVIELPEDATGLKGKRVAAELILDDVAYVMDIPGLPSPLVFHHDLEVECEALFKPCTYDDHPDAKNYVSSPLTQKQFDKAMTVIRGHILAASGNVLQGNLVSKAERGFRELDLAVEALSKYLVGTLANGSPAGKGKGPKTLASAFALAIANTEAGQPVKLHNDLPRSMSYVLRQRSIAFRR
jgi:hypothetical protein